MNDSELIKYIRYQIGQISVLMIDEEFYYATHVLGQLIGRMDAIKEGNDGQKDQKDPGRES